MGRHRTELKGERFGRLVALEYVGTSPKGGYALWRCRCDCGTEKVLASGDLKRSRSCGCLQRAYRQSEKPGFRTKHGQARSRNRVETPLYELWHRVVQHDLGTCERWRVSFTDFAEDVGSRPTPDHVFMRQNTGKGFIPGNCFWAQRKNVAANQKSTAFLTFDSQTMTISAWAEQTGISKPTIRNRLARGWSVEDTLTRPPGPKKRADLVGQRFGRLVVFEDAGNNRHSQSTWRCRCDCGTEKVVGISSLRNETTRSCGCLRTGRKVKPTKPVPGTFQCTACKKRQLLSEKIPGTNYRCQGCGLPKKALFNHAKRLWRGAKQRAQKAGLPFTLKVGDITIPKICPVLGVKMIMQDRASTPTLDRFIPQRGYTQENVSVISWRANALKRNGTLEEFEKLVAWMKGHTDDDS